MFFDFFFRMSVLGSYRNFYVGLQKIAFFHIFRIRFNVTLYFSYKSFVILDYKKVNGYFVNINYFLTSCKTNMFMIDNACN